jgi:hypothetical protein
MRYLETQWASLIPLARVADLLQEVWPVGDAVNPETVRTHLYATVERMEQERGDERQLHPFQGTEEEWEQQPLRGVRSRWASTADTFAQPTSRDGSQ